jgi:hypothetical protein
MVKALGIDLNSIYRPGWPFKSLDRYALSVFKFATPVCKYYADIVIYSQIKTKSDKHGK